MPSDQDKILAEISEILHVILEDFAIDVEITMDTTFGEDLEMDSIQIASLAGRLQARYANTVNLAQFVAGLALESLRELRIGQLVAYIADSLNAGEDGEAKLDMAEDAEVEAANR
jgi:acyl carrier protein